MAHNITGLWRERGKRVPFAVQRTSWRAFVAVITSVQPRWPSDRFAVVRGFLVATGEKPVERGEEGEHCINCANCFQWVEVPMPEGATP